MRRDIMGFVLFLLLPTSALYAFNTEGEQMSHTEKDSVVGDSIKFSKKEMEIGGHGGNSTLLDSIDREIKINQKDLNFFIGLTVLSVLEIAGSFAIFHFWVDEDTDNQLSNLPAVGLGLILNYGGTIQGLICILALFEPVYNLKMLKSKKNKLMPNLSFSSQGNGLAIKVNF